MFNKSSRMSRMTRAFGLALVASLAVSALAAGNASALSFATKAGGTSSLFTVQGVGQTIVSTTSGSIYSCSSSLGSGQFLNATSGAINLEFKGCAINSIPCTSSGRTSGTVVTSKLSFTLVYLDAAKSKFGLLLTPPLSTPFAECLWWGLPVRWTGSLIGQITSPALNAESTSASLAFTGSSGMQTYQQIEGAGVKYHLTHTVNGANAAEMALGNQGTLTFPTSIKFIP